MRRRILNMKGDIIAVIMVGAARQSMINLEQAGQLSQFYYPHKYLYTLEPYAPGHPETTEKEIIGGEEKPLYMWSRVHKCASSGGKHSYEVALADRGKTKDLKEGSNAEKFDENPDFKGTLYPD